MAPDGSLVKYGGNNHMTSTNNNSRTAVTHTAYPHHAGWKIVDGENKISFSYSGPDGSETTYRAMGVTEAITSSSMRKKR